MDKYNYVILKDLSSEMVLYLRMMQIIDPEKITTATYAEQITYMKILRSIKRFDKKNALRITIDCEKEFPLL